MRMTSPSAAASTAACTSVNWPPGVPAGATTWTCCAAARAASAAMRTATRERVGMDRMANPTTKRVNMTVLTLAQTPRINRNPPGRVPRAPRSVRVREQQDGGRRRERLVRRGDRELLDEQQGVQAGREQRVGQRDRRDQRA